MRRSNAASDSMRALSALVWRRTLRLRVTTQNSAVMTTTSKTVTRRIRFWVLSHEDSATTVMSSKERSRMSKGTSWPGLMVLASTMTQMPATRILEPTGMCGMGASPMLPGGWR